MALAPFKVQAEVEQYQRDRRRCRICTVGPYSALGFQVTTHADVRQANSKAAKGLGYSYYTLYFVNSEIKTRLKIKVPRILSYMEKPEERSKKLCATPGFGSLDLI